MTRSNLLIKFLLLFTIILINTVPRCSSVISDKRLCCDPECSVPIAEARTLMKYSPVEEDILSFDINVKVTIYSKGAGRRTDLWGVEINGKRGYAPVNFLREVKVYKCDTKYEVPTEYSIHNLNGSSKVLEVNKLEGSEGNDVPNDVSNGSGSLDSKSDTSVVNSFDKSVEQTVPDTKTITSSYEIIDGTSIPILEKELPTETTYSTQIVQNVATQNEQPTHSINPSTSSSSMTFTSGLPNDGSAPAQESKQFADGPESPAGAESNISKETQSEDSSKLLVSDHSTLVRSNEEGNLNLGDNISQDGSNVIEIEQRETDVNNVEQTIDKDSVPSDSNIVNVLQVNIETPKEVQRVEKIVKENINLMSAQQSTNERSSVEVPKVVNIENSIAAGQNMDKLTFSETESITADSKNYVDKQLLDKKMSENEAISNSFKTESIVSNETSLFVASVEKIADNVERRDIDLKSETTKDILETSLNERNEQYVQEGVITESNVTKRIMNVSNVIKLANDSSNKEKVQRENLTEKSAFKEELSNVTNISELASKDNASYETATMNEYNQDSIVRTSTDVNNNTYNENAVNDILLLQTNVTTEFDDDASQENIMMEHNLNVDELPRNRNLLNVKEGELEMDKVAINENDQLKIETLPNSEDHVDNEDKGLIEKLNANSLVQTPNIVALENQVVTPDVCDANYDCNHENTGANGAFSHWKENYDNEENAITETIKIGRNYWNTLLYVGITAFTTLAFSLGYYYIENARRDGQLIAKINKLEQEVLVSTKECTMLDEMLKSTKCKLNAIEDESFGSNEMVASLKTDLEALQIAKVESEDQIAMLEKDLESATEAGLELERMLRECLSSHNEDNSLAQSVEDLQERLNVQQVTNASLTNALDLKTRENDSLLVELKATKEKCQQLEIEVKRTMEELTLQCNLKNNLEEASTSRAKHLETRVNNITAEKSALEKQLKTKEIELEDLLKVINKMKSSNNLDLDGLYNVIRIKAEATQLREEKNELQMKLNELEGANESFKDHMTVINDEIRSLSERCRSAEKEKKDAETRLDVLSNFFKEKEAQRQKEEAIWLEKQGEVSSTVEKIQTMQNEIHNYKQQIEMLKREILDQEREYKNQISTLETKAHEHWVVARQNERRLEESKAEASQLRNRLTLVEKNMNETDSDSKLHRLETNGETTTSPPLFIGAETSSSPIMFTGSSGVPPSLSYMYGPPLPHFLPPPLHSSSGIPPYEVGQRPPPLGGRLSSPPPMSLHHHASGKYENPNSPPPPLSPPPLPPYSHHHHHHRPPPMPFANDRIHPPPFPPPLLPPTLGSTHLWGEETPSSLRNSGFHPHQREQRTRNNHKGSLHSSGESLDKSHHSGKA